MWGPPSSPDVRVDVTWDDPGGWQAGDSFDPKVFALGIASIRADARVGHPMLRTLSRSEEESLAGGSH
jgi:hypothetical protein